MMLRSLLASTVALTALTPTLDALSLRNAAFGEEIPSAFAIVGSQIKWDDVKPEVVTEDEPVSAPAAEHTATEASSSPESTSEIAPEEPVTATEESSEGKPKIPPRLPSLVKKRDTGPQGRQWPTRRSRSKSTHRAGDQSVPPQTPAAPHPSPELKPLPAPVVLHAFEAHVVPQPTEMTEASTSGHEALSPRPMPRPTPPTSPTSRPVPKPVPVPTPVAVPLAAGDTTDAGVDWGGEYDPGATLKPDVATPPGSPSDKPVLSPSPAKPKSTARRGGRGGIKRLFGRGHPTAPDHGALEMEERKGEAATTPEDDWLRGTSADPNRKDPGQGKKKAGRGKNKGKKKGKK